MDQRPVSPSSAHLEPAVKRRRLESDTLPNLEPTEERSQPGPVALSRRVYENISAGGHSRNVYGDIYNTYHVNSQDNAGAPAPSSAESRKTTDDVAGKLMEALAFDQMDTRLATISTAHAETCQWLFARKEYTSWRDPEALRKHHGFFWIKGKPGAGKSTLMKCARQYGEDTHKDLTISFFFNARGGDLERSVEGMYRSLLYQLLEGMPDLAPSLGKSIHVSTEQSWPLAELEDMLLRAVHALGTDAVTCYIDALDECDDEDARKMIEHFETLGQCAAKADTKFRVLLSSRHYPHIFLDRCLELNLENQKEHESDIAEYISCKLKIGKERLSIELEDDIRTRACGVFLWVVLVVRILNEYDARGKTHLLKKHLATIPDGLSELFKELLQRGTHDPDETLLALQWILFAQRPLRLDEFYHAVITNSGDDTMSERDHYEVTSDVMERFLLDSSKGLAEMTKGSHPIVQFIHESVRDYLLDKGFAIVNPMLSEDTFSSCHERLRDCCLLYLRNSQAALLRIPTDGVEEHMSRQREQVAELRAQVARTHPFLEYAVEGVLYHANLTHTPSRPQNFFVAEFPHAMWRKYHNMCVHTHYSRMRVETQPLYTFVVMGALELARIEIQNTSSPVENRLDGESFLSLLEETVHKQDQCMMDLLLENGAVPNNFSYPPASSCLSLAIREENSTMVRTLIDHGAGPICVKHINLREIVFVESLRYALDNHNCSQEVLECLLTRAPYSLISHWSELLTETLLFSRDLGYHSIEKLLLGRMELLVNNLTSSEISTTVEELDAVFVAACEYRQGAVVKLLIEHNILKASNRIAQAFEAAVRSGCDKVVRALLDSGIEVDIRLDDLGKTALVVASEKGHASIVSLLLHHGAEVPHRCSALFLAARGGHAPVVQMLLDAGVDPNTCHDYPDVGSRWGTALHMAVRSKSAETVRVLLGHASIDADALDKHGKHAICTASWWGNVECVQLLLERNVPLEHLNDAVAMAWNEGFGEIVDMLVTKGASDPAPLSNTWMSYADWSC